MKFDMKYVMKYVMKYDMKILILIMLCLILSVVTGDFPQGHAVNVSNVDDEGYVDAYKISFDGNHIGVVDNRQTFQAVIDGIRREYMDIYGMNISFSQQFTLEPVRVEKQSINQTGEIKSILLKNIDILGNGLVMTVEGEEIGCFRSLSDANAVLERLMYPYQRAVMDSGNKLEDIYFKEDIKFEFKEVELSQLQTVNDAYQKLSASAQEIQTYQIQAGDTLWGISNKFDIKLEDLFEANPSLVNAKYLQLGQEINLAVSKHLLHVVTVETAEYQQDLPYETEVQQSSSMYKTQTKILQKGVKGKSQVTAKIYKYNGLEQEREVVSQQIVKEPVKQIILRGTKSPVNSTVTAGTGIGEFVWPTSGVITSQMGARWGRLHAGIDIAGPIGTPVYAAADGTVCFTGVSGGYGNLIRINHGSDTVTYYAHLKSISVKEGQHVKKGQRIGYMGNTGRSTGPHLHFEIRKNGNPVDPLTRLK
jgi:murein DD-endopeptidase MepM/ murein hydrolase activator NlpD